MKRLYASVVGIDQGSVILFSDFDKGGPMWTDTGPRKNVTPVLFSETYLEIPSVFVTLDMWDMDKNKNHRIDIAAENITPEGFDLVFRTWEDTKIARARAAWMAFGEVRGEDDWEV